MRYSRQDAKSHARSNMTGIWAAALTPFTSSLTIDEDGLRQHIDHWVGTLGIDGIFVGGKQGECFAMSLSERKRLFELAVQACRGRPLSSRSARFGQQLGEPQDHRDGR